MPSDWVRWHDAYDDPASGLSTRLALVQKHLSAALASAPDGPIRVVSLCAGQGRDVIGVLSGHPRRDDVTALLVELDPANVQTARDHATAAALPGVTIRQADAGLVANFADALPANVLLLCGIFGNVDDEDIKRTASAAGFMCAPGGTVIWTRHRRPTDLTGDIRSWFASAGFEELAFEMPATTTLTGVGVHRRLPADQPPADSSPAGPTPSGPTPSGPTPAGPTPPGLTPARPSPSGRLFTFRADRQAGPGPAPR